MGRYQECIAKAVKAGQISKDAEEILREFEATPERGIEMALEITKMNRRNTALEAISISRAIADIESHEKGIATGIMSLLARDVTEKAGYSNIDINSSAIIAQYDAKLADYYSKFRTRTAGLSQDTAGLGELVRSIFGRKSADPEINQMAKELAAVFEDMRVRFNNSGGHINKNEFWNLPIRHNPRAVKGGRGEMMQNLEQWKSDIIPLLDRNKMKSEDGSLLNDEQLTEALDYVYKTIITGGANKVNEFKGGAKLGKKLSDRNSDRRFLYFKDGDSWMKYNEKYGQGDIFTVINDHLESMSKDIALIERLGPNPRKTFDALMSKAKAAGTSDLKMNMLESVFKVVSGHVDGTRITGLSDFMQATRNVLTASTLGGAFLSSISDIGATLITSRYNSLSAVKVWKKQLKLMNPKNEADRKLALRIGLGAESMINRASAGNRYADVYGVGVTAKAAEVVIRASFLQTMTDSGRKAFGMEYAGLLSDNFGNKFADLDKNMLKAFKTYGIDESDWNKFRATKKISNKGIEFADLTKGEKFQSMIISEMDFAVPTPDARIRAITTGGVDRGTLPGEVWRSAMMFKSFPITMIATHLQRGLNQTGLKDKVAYFGSMGMASIVFGGIALQAKDIARGREPRPIDGKFMAAAFAQGGGAGIFGDFLFSDVNRFGGGFFSTLLGPTAELGDKAASLTVGNVQQALAGENTKILGESIKFAERYTPNIWQVQLFKSAIFNQMALQADPKMQKKFNRMVRKRQKEYGQKYWWKPGKLTP